MKDGIKIRANVSFLGDTFSSKKKSRKNYQRKPLLAIFTFRYRALSMGKEGKKRKKMTAIDDDRDRSGIIFDPDRRHWIEDR